MRLNRGGSEPSKYGPQPPLHTAPVQSSPPSCSSSHLSSMQTTLPLLPCHRELPTTHSSRPVTAHPLCLTVDQQRLREEQRRLAMELLALQPPPVQQLLLALQPPPVQQLLLALQSPPVQQQSPQQLPSPLTIVTPSSAAQTVGAVPSPLFTPLQSSRLLPAAAPHTSAPCRPLCPSSPCHRELPTTHSSRPVTAHPPLPHCGPAAAFTTTALTSHPVPAPPPQQRLREEQRRLAMELLALQPPPVQQLLLALQPPPVQQLLLALQQSPPVQQQSPQQLPSPLTMCLAPPPGSGS
ncbi:hypothetical protein Q5P01_002874 [Channa striata]|uniref:Uncharacterized protein n=1 Tax=Channa striata TaxID=64152 RepID=A0AA88T462_CHASR|nr:hypothetical protein Q5P01_002874 [Channa striata]